MTRLPRLLATVFFLLLIAPQSSQADGYIMRDGEPVMGCVFSFGSEKELPNGMFSDGFIIRTNFFTSNEFSGAVTVIDEWYTKCCDLRQRKGKWKKDTILKMNFNGTCAGRPFFFRYVGTESEVRQGFLVDMSRIMNTERRNAGLPEDRRTSRPAIFEKNTIR
ncbi:MAG: hypothetical protein HGA67_02750 [Candidatus Yonathbacteria bacterium]|nr:hypothetical protein [Candidatus Yonathbacteria bacterium]